MRTFLYGNSNLFYIFIILKWEKSCISYKRKRPLLHSATAQKQLTKIYGTSLPSMQQYVCNETLTILLIFWMACCKIQGDFSLDACIMRENDVQQLNPQSATWVRKITYESTSTFIFFRAKVNILPQLLMCITPFLKTIDLELCVKGIQNVVREFFAKSSLSQSQLMSLTVLWIQSLS